MRFCIGGAWAITWRNGGNGFCKGPGRSGSAILGKYSFIAYDLFVKRLAFYVGDQIDPGIEVLAMKSMQAQMLCGPDYYEGALYDLALQDRGVPDVPLIGIAP